MPAPVPRPLDRKAQRAETQDRLEVLEARPRIIVPTLLVPVPVLGYVGADWYMAADVAAFESRWDARPIRWSQSAVWTRVAWRTGAGTTGEVRLAAWAVRSGGAAGWLYSDAVSLGAASSGSVDFLWLHQADIWTEGGIVSLQGRRTAGGNSVEIAMPHMALIDPADATAAGA